ncbi:MAG: HDOD domain-containing protein [Bacteroidota bacterium]|jgi:HD-like signal output (HDOD) protein
MRDIRAEIEDVNEIVPFPTVVASVMAELLNNEVAIKKIIQLIETDVALTALILRVSNSAYYGLRGEVTSISSSVMMLGIEEVNRLMLIYQMKQRIFRLNREQRSYLERLWKHSVATAIIARDLASLLLYKCDGKEFTAGLLHDMGKIVLVQHFSHSLIVTQKMIADLGLTDVEAEMQSLAITHAEIGGSLGEAWNLPPLFVEVMRYHHSPADAVLDPKLAAIVRTADVLSELWDMGIGEQAEKKIIAETDVWKVLLHEFPRVGDLDAALVEQQLKNDFESHKEFVRMML